MKQSDRIGQQEIAFVRDRLWDSKNRLHREGALPPEEAMPFGMGARCAQIPMESASAAVIRADSAAAVAAASQKQQNPDQGITAVVAAVVTATAVVCSESVVAAA